MLDIIRANAQSWGVKIAFGLIIVVFVFWGVGSFTGTDPAVLLKVDGKAITAQDFLARFRPQVEAIRAGNPGLTQEELQQYEPQLKAQVLQGLLMERLLLQESKRTGIIVTPQELRRQIERIPAFQNDQGIFDPATYERVLKSAGTMPGVYEAEVRNELLIAKFQAMAGAAASVSESQARNFYTYQAEQRVLDVLLFKAEDYRAEATPGAEEVQKYYDSHQASFLLPAQADIRYVAVNAQTLAAAETVGEDEINAYYTRNPERYTNPERVRARHIIVLADDDSDESADIKAKEAIVAARVEIESGRDFTDVASEISQDGSASEGGDLGWFERGQMVPEFEEVAFTLSPGVVSDPVRTQFGWHLILVEEHAAQDLIPLAEVHDEIAHLLAVDKAAPKVQDVLDNLLIAVINDQELATVAAQNSLEVSDTGLQDAVTLGQMLHLKPEDIQTLMSAPVGKTLDTAFSTGEGYVIARVNASEPPKTRAFDEVKNDITEQLSLEKARELAMKAAEETRATMSGYEVPGTLENKRIDSPSVGRDGYAPGFSSPNPLLAEAVFSTQSREWLPAPYTVDEGAALVRVKEVLPPNEDVWEAVGSQLVQVLTNAKQERQYLAFMQGLLNAATIETGNTELLDQLR